jgi:hypothetical protein
LEEVSLKDWIIGAEMEQGLIQDILIQRDEQKKLLNS